MITDVGCESPVVTTVLEQIHDWPEEENIEEDADDDDDDLTW